MSDLGKLMVQLGKVFPEDKSLSPIEVSNVLNTFFEKRGLAISTRYMRKYELTHELISRIRSSFTDFKQDIKSLTGYKSDRLVRNKYFEMVYAILNHYHFGIAGKSGKLKKISEEEYAVIFDIDRKTLKRNLKVVDFYNHERYKFLNNLEQIFYKIEEGIFDN